MRKYQIIIAVFLYLFAAPARVHSRDFPMQHITADNGLPSNTVYGIYRDSKGFLWIGTDRGIARYNGIEFETFTTEDGLPGNEVFFFLEDHEGRLWMSNHSGALCYYKDGFFYTSANTPFLKKAVTYPFLNFIALEKDSSITISFIDRQAFINIKGDSCRSFYINKDNFPTQEDILTIHKISEGSYGILCPDKTFEIDTASKYIANTSRANNDYFKDCYSQDRWYLFSGKGIYSNGQVMKFNFAEPLAKSYISIIYQDKNSWFIGTNNGLYINNDIQILKGISVCDVTQDIEDNYWISTVDNGLFCLGKDYATIAAYDTIYSTEVKYARTIGKYLFYVTTNSNLYRFDNGNPTLLFDYFKHLGKYYRLENDWEHYLHRKTLGHAIDTDYKYYNIESNVSFILNNLNTNNPGMQLLEEDSLYDYYDIRSMYFGKRLIYIRNRDYISVIDKLSTSGNRSRSRHITEIGKRNRGKMLTGFAVASDGSLWYSGFGKVNKVVDTTTLPQEQFGNFTFKWMQICGNNLVGITPKNQLLICRNFEDNNIYIDSVIAERIEWDKLYKLNDSTFLVSTNNLYRLLQLHNSPIRPGYTIQIIENNSLPLQTEYICSNDSCCYFFKKGTITRIPIGGLAIKHIAPRIFFKSINTRDRSYPIAQGMIINYNESKNLSISFTPLSFGSKNIICEYSISKDTTEYWRQVKNNEINLFDPSYGQYTVKVKAKNLSGTFSEPFVFHFTISKPFWATWWFIMCSILLFIGVTTLAARLLTMRNSRKRELAHLNEIKYLRSEYKALNALMNPHFIFNTLNNVQWLVNNDDKVTANRYLRVFADLVRQNMHNVSRELIPLSKEIDLVSNYLKLEKLRFKDALNYEINISNESDIYNIEIPPLLIQPLVENAIKHGLLPGSPENNLLKMNIYKNGNNLCIDVMDNGIGINESQKNSRSQHKSTGIENIRKRIEKLSVMHNINISLDINELKSDADSPLGTLARICINLVEE